MSKLHALIREIIKKELEEISSSGAAGAYDTPNAFTGMTRKGEEKRKLIAKKAPGYTLVGKDDTEPAAPLKEEREHPLLPLIRLIKEAASNASKDAKKHGLTSAGWGTWKDTSGTTVAKTVNGELVWKKDKGGAPQSKPVTAASPNAKPKPSSKPAVKSKKSTDSTPKKAVKPKKAGVPRKAPINSFVTTEPNPADNSKVLNVAAFKTSDRFHEDILRNYISHAVVGSKAEDTVRIDGKSTPDQEAQVMASAIMPWIKSGWAIDTVWDDNLAYDYKPGSQHHPGETPYMYGNTAPREFGGGYRVFFSKER